VGVWAVASIPESQAHRVKVGQTAAIKVVSLGDKTFSGKLIRFGTEANPELNTLEAIFLLENPNNDLLFKKDYELENTFEKVPVVLGERNRNRTEIILQNKELNIIDEVVIHGGYLLTHTQADKTSLKEALDEAHGHEHNEDVVTLVLLVVTIFRKKDVR